MQRITSGRLVGVYESTGIMPKEDIDRLIALSTSLATTEKPLITLNLGDNNLSRLPSNFTKLSTLQPPIQELYLWSNPNIGSTSSSPSPLHLFVSQVCSLSHLTKLDLTLCKLKSIPDDRHQLGQLQQLKYLDLSWNGLTTLPASITTLKQLEELYIMNNKLRSIPLEIGNLPRLHTLWCYVNPLVSPLNSLAGKTSWENWEKHSREAIALLRACLEGTTKYQQIKLVLIGNGQEGKVSNNQIFISFRYFLFHRNLSRS